MLITTVEASGLGIFSSTPSSARSLLTGLFSYIAYAITHRKVEEEDLPEVNPSNTIFVFDVHGVIFKLSVIQIIKEVIKDPSSLWIITMMLRPMLCVNLLKSQLSGGVAEELIFNVAKDKPHLAWFVPKAFNLINAQVPIKSTVKMLEQLKQKGYKVYILSNMGERSLDYIKDRHADVFKLFDGIFTTTHRNGYIKKPQPQMYQNYLDKFGHDPKKLIFIDDKQQNLRAAEKFGMRTILFTSPRKLFKILSKRKAFI